MVQQLFDKLLPELGIGSHVICDGVLPHGLTAHSRTDGEHTYLFVENYDPEEARTLQLRCPMLDLLSGDTVDSLTLLPYGFTVFKSI